MRRFGQRDFAQLTQRFSRYVDMDGPLGYHEADRSGQVLLNVDVCIYAWVSNGWCMYVGQVQRCQGGQGAADRFAHHHRNTDGYDGVWIIPMRSRIPVRTLSAYERAVIRRYRPAHNRQHVGSGT